MCPTFSGGEVYQKEVEDKIWLFEGPRYETVTPEEIAAIKSAMVAGSGGIATHAGHWYTCRNGHPVSTSIARCLLTPLVVLVVNEGRWPIRRTWG